jgi:hypothetical protein
MDKVLPGETLDQYLDRVVPPWTFKKSLAYRLERRIAYREGRNSVCDVGDEMLSPANRLLVADDDIKHLERWIEDGDNPIWEAFCDFRHITFISGVLYLRRVADAADDGHDFQKEEVLALNNRLSILAGAAEMLADFYRDPEFMRDDCKWSEQWPLMPLARAIRFLDREAALLRASIVDNIPETDISRQENTKEGGGRSRGQLTFMREAHKLVSGEKRSNHIVAELTNIAFDLDDVTATEVQVACRPRRRKAKHSTAK